MLWYHRDLSERTAQSVLPAFTLQLVTLHLQRNMAVTLVLLVISCIGIYYLLLKKSRIDKFIERFSGPTSFPVIGNGWILANPESRLTNLSQIQREFGNRVPLIIGSLKFLMIFHPDDIGKVLASREMGKSRLYDLLFTDWLGSTIFYAKEKRHFQMRKMILPATDYKQVDDFESNFNENSKTLVQLLETKAANGEVTDMRWLFTLCTLDMMLQFITGKTVNCLVRGDTEYATAVQTETKCIFERGWSPWLWPEWTWKISPLGRRETISRKVLHDFMEKIVQDRKAELRMEEEFFQKEKVKALDLLIRAGYRGTPGVDDKYIRDETNAGIFAGHDTVASGLVFALFLLASNPEEQAKVQLELDEVFGDDRETFVKASDLPKLKYLECCIKESLRLYPPVPIKFRASQDDFELDEKTTIPKGAEVLVSPWVTHRLPEFFPEPNAFRPSRFFPENCIGRHPYAYIPFSAGPRNCMGQKIALIMEKIILAHIFRNFTVELACPAESVVPSGDLIMFPKNGLNVKLKLR